MFFIVHRGQVPSKEDYDRMLLTLNKDITPVSFTIGSRENYWLASYAILKLGDSEVIVRARSYNEFVKANGVVNAMFCPRIVHVGELFDCILEAHLLITHGKAEKTWNAVKRKYSNVSRNICEMFVSTCPECVMKSSTSQTRKIPLQPILSNTFNDRGQMDCIDMQATPDGEYKWILHYQDNLTKFSYLRALRNKCKL